MELVHGADDTRCVGLQKKVMITGNTKAPCIINCSLTDESCAFIQKFLGSQSIPLVAYGNQWIVLGLSPLWRTHLKALMQQHFPNTKDCR